MKFSGPPRTATTLLLLALLAASARAATPDDLLRAYPDALRAFDGTNLVWRDGTLMPLGPRHPGPADEDALQHASLADQLAASYPAGSTLPPRDDPGRARNGAFFDKMYGDCAVGQVTPKLVRVVWLPRTWGHTVSITSVNGLDHALAAVSRELDDLPDADKKYLYPVGGTYNCRHVAGSDAKSMHAWGAAIDLNPAYSDYWRWARPGPAPLGPAPLGYVNRIPAEVVDVFERHGFIWGGRWAHYDTMHFEYRPELLPAAGE